LLLIFFCATSTVHLSCSPQVWHKGRKVDTCVGASEPKFRAMVEKHVPRGSFGVGAHGATTGTASGSGGAGGGPSYLFFPGGVKDGIEAVSSWEIDKNKSRKKVFYFACYQNRYKKNLN
jgi:hypothetical protein